MPHILLRILSFSTSDPLVTGWSSVLTEVQDGDCLSVRRSVDICCP